MGSLKNKINELEERIKSNRKAIAELDEMFYKFSGPKGYPTGTSWQDYDCIRGGNKEMDLFRYVTERERLKTIIEIDEKILDTLKKNLKIKEDIKLIVEEEKQNTGGFAVTSIIIAAIGIICGIGAGIAIVLMTLGN